MTTLRGKPLKKKRPFPVQGRERALEGFWSVRQKGNQSAEDQKEVYTICREKRHIMTERRIEVDRGRLEI